MYNGVIEKLFEKGFGFIRVAGRDKTVFFHASKVRGGMPFEEMAIGQSVSFEDIVSGDKGEMAVGVEAIR